MDGPLVFLSTPSARRATSASSPAAVSGTISIHALREEGDAFTDVIVKRYINFYPRPPRGGRPGRQALRRLHQDHFYPRPPRGGRRAQQRPRLRRRYFYPRPPRGGRRSVCSGRVRPLLFLSTPSARRATTKEYVDAADNALFLSTPSARRATLNGKTQILPLKFLSTPSARRATTTSRDTSTK